MPIFQITINLTDLQYLLFIYFSNIELKLFHETLSAFCYKTVTINLIAVTKFFYTTYDVVFNLLFNVGQAKKKLLELISTFFINVKINGQ